MSDCLSFRLLVAGDILRFIQIYVSFISGHNVLKAAIRSLGAFLDFFTVATPFVKGTRVVEL